jgi:hypothetical protein
MTSRDIDLEIVKISKLNTIKDLINYLSSFDENLKIDISGIQYSANIYGADFRFNTSILARDYAGHNTIEE